MSVPHELFQTSCRHGEKQQVSPLAVASLRTSVEMTRCVGAAESRMPSTGNPSARLKPRSFKGALYAALKRRSSTGVRAFVCFSETSGSRALHERALRFELWRGCVLWWKCLAKPEVAREG